MSREKEQERRGGKREGAGRPKGTSKLYSFRADKEVAEYIDTQHNKTDFIRSCIVREMAQSPSPTTLPSPTFKEEMAGTFVSAQRVAPLSLPFFDIKVVAGFPIPLNTDEMAQDIELLKMLCPHPDSSYLIRVRGNSMIDAGVHDGDILIVDKSLRNPSEKEVAVCELNGEYTVKRIVERQDKRWLVPANPDYPEIEIGRHDQFCVWGVVTYIIHKPAY